MPREGRPNCTVFVVWSYGTLMLFCDEALQRGLEVCQHVRVERDWPLVHHVAVRSASGARRSWTRRPPPASWPARPGRPAWPGRRRDLPRCCGCARGPARWAPALACCSRPTSRLPLLRAVFIMASRRARVSAASSARRCWNCSNDCGRACEAARALPAPPGELPHFSSGRGSLSMGICGSES